MDDDIRTVFEILSRPDPDAQELCEHILASGISCVEAGLVCERCGPYSPPMQRALAASVLPRFV
jgi:hypothetical protein